MTETSCGPVRLTRGTRLPRRRLGRLTVAAACATVLLLAGCAGAPRVPLDQAQLDAYFQDVPEKADAVDPLAVTDEMRAFARFIKGRARADSTKLEHLLKGMFERGLSELQYHPFTTLTAAETFERQVGNCLSYTNLFVALARESGMKVSYQVVDVPPMWLSDGESVVRNTHINTLVRNARDNSILGRDFAIDFNNTEYSDRYPVEVVTDDYAIAVYHGNLAVEALSRDDTDTALAHLWRALSIRSDVAHLWVNLGVARSRRGEHDASLAAYERALALDPANPSALVNISVAYDRLGLTQRSADIRR